MYRESLVVRTKLTPPRLPKHTLHRARLTRRLLEALDYRLTIVHAGTGYGKSTALAALAAGPHPLVWYHLDREDVDPLMLFLHLFHGLRAALPALSETPLAILEGSEGSSDPPWSAAVDALANSLAGQLDHPLLLVLDDLHHLRQEPGPLRILDRLIGRAPADLHIILSTRYPARLPTLVNWRVRGEVLEIGQEELTFTPAEITALFRDQYDVALSGEESRRLAAETEGWAIALQLVWQNLRIRSTAPLPVGRSLSSLGQAADLETLFDYLAQEVLEQQPPDIQELLRVTAVLREMTASICDCLRASDDSALLLRYLLENGLFVVDLGDGHLRYHHLFRDFMLHRLAPEAARMAHRRAAACCQQAGELEEAIYHLLAAEALDEAAAIIAQLGPKMVRAGRLDTLGEWIYALPPEILERQPTLLVCLGDMARLHSRFDEALGWYSQAEERCRGRGDLPGVGQALRGQARVYLDTVDPRQAEHLLQEALRLADGVEDRETRARLLELLAENRLNLGRTEEAERLRAQVRELREEAPGEAELSVRVLLRTGRLDQARLLLEQQAEAERRAPVLRPRSHRETPLLLSLILAFQGQGEAAYRCAIEGTERGEMLGSPFSSAVGLMRQGHAWLLRQEPQGYEQACRCYRQALSVGDSLAVPRLKVEAFWGLCRAHGFCGEVELAEQAAAQGVAIAHPAGDEWIAALICVTMGASYALSHRFPAAIDWLTEAGSAFRDSNDTYGEAVTRLWQCLVWWETGDGARLKHGLDELLRLVRTHGYAYLFTRQTLLGPPDPRCLVPLLLHARDDGQQLPFSASLLAELGLRDLELHPGYQLRVQMLGPFRAWRGAQEIAPAEWRRDKARHLFQLLLTYRRTPLDREQLIEMLWPGGDPQAGQRNFKVALNALYGVLEPQRRPSAPSAYVLRDGSCYGLRPGADLWIDVDEFVTLIAAGDRLFDQDPEAALEHYRRALALYQSEYLPDCLYEEWCSEQREHLLTLYLRTADRLAQALAARELWAETISVCQAILARDDCWERAYALLMTAYAHTGNRAQALRTYQRCVEKLRQELDIAPAPSTVCLYESLLQSADE